MDRLRRTGFASSRSRPSLALGLAACLSVLCAVAGIASRRPEPHYARIAQRVARFLPREHLARQPLDETMSSRAWTHYIDSLDNSRLYFLQSDIDRFKVHETGLGDALRRGDIQFAYDVFETFLARVRDRRDYAAQWLGKGFDFDKQESFTWRRKDAAWPRDRAEWDDLWRRKIKNEYLRRVLAQEWAEQQRATEKSGADAMPRPDDPDKEDEEDDEDADDFSLSPQDFVIRPYQRYLDMLQDSDSEWVLEKYLSAFARAYDPHSDYMSMSSVEDFEIQMKLSLVGIGALLRAEDGAAQVVRVLPGGPAERDTRDIRLKPGDKIIAVGQDDKPPVDVLHWPLNRTIRLIRGKKGTRVVLVCIAADDPTGSTIKKVDLVRDEVRLEEQAAKLTVADTRGFDGQSRKIGVIHLPAFYADMASRSLKNPNPRSSAEDVRSLIEDAVAQNVDGLILDLRNNGGGALPEAIRIAGLFTGRGPVVQVGGLEGVNIIESRDTEYALYSGPLMVMVTRVSASASEIVAGALQDYGRAIVAGDSKTHGKGTVQTVARLGLDPKLGKLKITSWIYYRISGKSTQIKGIVPDIVLPSAFETMELGEDYLPHPVDWSTVPKADYRPVADLTPAIVALETKSALRRSTNAGFQAYMKLLNRMERMNRETEVSLHMEERKKSLQAEREFSDAQSALISETIRPSDEEGREKDDIVLDECLRIMADYAALVATGKAPAPLEPTPAETAERKSLPHALRDWLMN